MGRMCWRWHLLFRFQSFARVTFFCADLSTFYRILSSPSCFPWPSWSARPLLSDCGSRPSQWFHQPILHIHHSLLFHRRWRQRQGAENDDIGSSDAARDVGYKRHFSKEQLEDWKTPLEIVKDNMWGACTFKCTICAVKVLALVHLPQTIYWQSEWVLKMGPGKWGEITRRDGSHHWTLEFEHNKMR